jgi:hypothetical protein
MAEETTEIRADVRIGAKQFRRFALFDAFCRQRRWVSPAVFAGFFILFALIAFWGRARAQQAGLLGGVLLGVGVVLPGVYFFSYLLSINGQIKKMKLAKPRFSYALRLNGEGLEATAGKETRLFPWAQAHAAYRRAECTYVYVSEKQAFLLPHDQVVQGPDALWSLLDKALPASKRHGRARKRRG